MDFNLNADQLFIKDTIRRFMQRECPREKAHEMDEKGIFPAELLEKIARSGFCGLSVPEDYEGGALPGGADPTAGQGLLNAALIVEEIATLSPTLAGLYGSIAFFGGHLVSRFGSAAQCRRLLPAVARGELVISLGLQDDLVQDRLIHQFEGGAFSLNGCLPYVPMVQYAGYLLAQTQSHSDPARALIFFIPTGHPGVHIEALDTVGQHGAGAGQVCFSQVKLSAEEVLGGPPDLSKDGTDNLEYIQAVSHLVCAALGLGLSQGAFAYTAQYASERAQFGQPILQFEAIQEMLVDQALGLQAARWLVYHACWLADQGKPFALEAALACLQAENLARQAGMQSVQILGGYGYMAEYDAQRYLRDALHLLFAGESVELLKNRIGKHMWSPA
jgi:alkylation response protein AidB-like acyl-CoA dehydrogenase